MTAKKKVDAEVEAPAHAEKKTAAPKDSSRRDAIAASVAQGFITAKHTGIHEGDYPRFAADVVNVTDEILKALDK